MVAAENRSSTEAEWKIVESFLYAKPLIERFKSLEEELKWVILDRQNPDQHVKYLPDYCYNIFNLVRKTYFKALPTVEETVLLLDGDKLATAKSVAEAKTAIRLDWKNLGRLLGMVVRSLRFAKLEVKDLLIDGGFDNVPVEKLEKLLVMVLGRQWVEENQVKIMAEPPSKWVSEMFKQHIVQQAMGIREKQPYYESVAFEWGNQAMIDLSEGMAEGMGKFLGTNGEFMGETTRAGIYLFLLLAWPEIKAMLESEPKKTLSDLREWMLPFMRTGMVTYLDIDVLRDVCAPPPQGIGLSLRPLKSRRKPPVASA